MTKFDRQLTFSTEEYVDFDELVDELFWNDMYLYQEDTYYIHDVNQDYWYSIEQRYHYGDILQLFEEGKVLRFDEIKDEDLIEELREVLDIP